MLLSLPAMIVRRYLVWLFAAIQGAKDKVLSNSPASPTQRRASGDYEVFIEQLFRTHYASLCRAVYPIVRDQDTAEDIVQDVFLKVWRNQTTLDTDQHVKAYLFRAAINTALNFLEKNKRNTLWDDSFTDRFGVNETEETLNYQEVQQKIAQALDQLPPKCKVVFSLSRFEDMSYAEIARHLDISVKAVEKHMGKALKIMRQYVYGG